MFKERFAICLSKKNLAVRYKKILEQFSYRTL